MCAMRRSTLLCVISKGIWCYINCKFLRVGLPDKIAKVCVFLQTSLEANLTALNEMTLSLYNSMISNWKYRWLCSYE